MRRFVPAVFVVLGAVLGCGSAGSSFDSSGSGGAGGAIAGSGGTGATTGAGGAPQATGLPCDVAMMLQDHCWSCHGSPLAGGAPYAIITYADLAKPSKGDPTKSVAQLAVARMLDTVSPMPPKPDAPVPPAERAAFMTWVNAGLPMGTCDTGSTSSSSGSTSSGSATSSSSGGDYNTPLTCTSNTYWMGGDSGNANMHPGRACRSCHVLGGKASGKTFDVAGTVYPSAHEPDDCDGVSVSGAQVIITDATGQDFPLDVNGAGNFYHQDFFGILAFKPPIKARVVYNGKTRAMMAAQMSGDCNSCHTQDGAMNAPGRIMLP